MKIHDAMKAKKYVAPKTEFVKLIGMRAVLIAGGGSGGTHNSFAKPSGFDTDELFEDMEYESEIWE